MTDPAAHDQPSPGIPSPPGVPDRPGPVRRLYLWVLHWADTPYGTPALFLLSLAESSFFPVPPDVLQIALSVSRPKQSFYYAAVSGVGSVVGAVIGWLIGFAFWAAVGWFFFDYVPGVNQENFDRVQQLYNQNAILALFGAAFTPIPFKVFTIAAGVFQVSLWELVVASSIGRFARFMLVAAFIYLFGPAVKALLDKYFGLVTFVLFVLLIAGFVAIKYLV